MSRRSKGPHLWLRPARYDDAGHLTHTPIYFILDSGIQRSTGFGPERPKDAQQALAAFIANKYEADATSRKRDPSIIPVRDVLSLYLKDQVPKVARPKEAARRLARVAAFFGNSHLSDVTGRRCRDYAAQSSTDTMARRDLEELRAAINHHRTEGLHDRIVSVVLPDRRPARERWLDRDEAAALLWEAWRRPKCKQIARFILVALYTGRRAAVVCGASFKREQGRAWVDLRAGFLWPPERVRVTKKRNPPIPLPERLLAHLRAWRNQGARYVVEWGGHAVTRVDKTVSLIAEDAGLGHVTPHVLRHTAATWQMLAGTDMWEAGKYLGMTARTLESTYAHHRPGHLTGARDAYSRNRQSIANEIREPKPNKPPRPPTKKRGRKRQKPPTQA